MSLKQKWSGKIGPAARTSPNLSKLHKLYDESSKGNKLSRSKFLSACKLIGLLEEDKKSWDNFKKSTAKVDESFILKKIKERNGARKKGDYKLADKIRKELEDNGVIIEDKQNKTTWKYKWARKKYIFLIQP